MKTINIILIISLITGMTLFGQDQFQIKKSFDVNEKQKKLFKMAFAWVEQQSDFVHVTTNNENKIEADGYVVYNNPVKYAGSSTMSRAFADQTKGKITFHFQMTVNDNKLEVVLTDFNHVPKNEIDKIVFGTLTSNEKAPEYLKSDYDGDYCDKVWQNMKLQAQEKTELFLTTLPEQLVSSK